MNGILSTEFTVERTGDSATLGEFFEHLERMDKAISFIPLSGVGFYSPARVEDPEEAFDEEAYGLAFFLRGELARKKLIVKVDELLELPEGEEFVNTLITEKDSFFTYKGTDFKVEDEETIFDRGGFFLTETALVNAAKLCKLSGDALAKPSAYRDAYLAHLFNERCATAAVKREPQPGFTAIVFSAGNLNRCFAIRSGKYTSIEQSLLKTALFDLLASDDYGEGECRKWHVDHDISYADLELPHVEAQLKTDYPELPEFPLIPGIRISTGSTGLNTLKVSMTYRRPEAAEPVILGSATQKHCNTFEREEFLKRCHEEVWSRYGELPRKLSELQSEPLTEGLGYFLDDVLKRINIQKIFMQKEAPKTEKADYITKIKVATKEILEKDSITAPTKYDVAIALMDAAEKITVADSYKESVRAALMQAAFYM